MLKRTVGLLDEGCRSKPEMILLLIPGCLLVGSGDVLLLLHVLADFCKPGPVLPLRCFPSLPWPELPSLPPAALQKLPALTETVLVLPADVSWGYKKKKSSSLG